MRIAIILSSREVPPPEGPVDKDRIIGLAGFNLRLRRLRRGFGIGIAPNAGRMAGMAWLRSNWTRIHARI